MIGAALRTEKMIVMLRHSIKEHLFDPPPPSLGVFQVARMPEVWVAIDPESSWARRAETIRREVANATSARGLATPGSGPGQTARGGRRAQARPPARDCRAGMGHR